jgi:hypothetical protein
VLPLKRFLQPRKQCVRKSMDNPVKVNSIFQVLHTIMRISYAHNFLLCMLLIYGLGSRRSYKWKHPHWQLMKLCASKKYNFLKIFFFRDFLCLGFHWEHVKKFGNYVIILTLFSRHFYVFQKDMKVVLEMEL